MIYEATLFTSYYGQSCINRWNYLRTGTPAVVTGSFALLSAMGGIPPTLTPTQFPTGTMLRIIQQQIVNQVTFVALTVKAIYDVTDFYELPWVPALTGANATQGLSPVMGYGFRTSRVRTDIRRGTKRIVGVDEGQTDGGGVLNSGGAAAAAAIADAMTVTLEYTDEGNTLSFAPIVVKKEPYIPSGSTQTAYRYYPTLAEQMDFIATGILWQPYPSVRSQTSRQYGRGQ